MNGITDAAYSLLRKLDDQCNGDRRLLFTMQNLASRCGEPLPKVRAALAELIRAGYVKQLVRPKPYHATPYEVTIPRENIMSVVAGKLTPGPGPFPPRTPKSENSRTPEHTDVLKSGEMTRTFGPSDRRKSDGRTPKRSRKIPGCPLTPDEEVQLLASAQKIIGTPLGFKGSYAARARKELRKRLREGFTVSQLLEACSYAALEYETNAWRQLKDYCYVWGLGFQPLLGSKGQTPQGRKRHAPALCKGEERQQMLDRLAGFKPDVGPSE